eukprot:TRINITY_DN5676_c0_g1_i2.p1 TRINITY_DN5676_c0_g1~~TRINITY_DN5676_c0_g1_i2.p1  ORF type:complete len:145 (-),score=28.59 TRINITY_DN5676_c0_g1_i2:182-616(-)
MCIRDRFNMTETQFKNTGISRQQIPGYMGFIPGIKSENIYGKTYGQTTQISAKQTHHIGSDLTGQLRFTSIMQENYVNFDPKSSHISDFNPLKRNGLGEEHSKIDDEQRKLANHTSIVKKYDPKYEPQTKLTFKEAQELSLIHI